MGLGAVRNLTNSTTLKNGVFLFIYNDIDPLSHAWDMI